MNRNATAPLGAEQKMSLDVKNLFTDNTGYFKNSTDKKAVTGNPEYEYDQNGNLTLDKNSINYYEL